MFGCKENHSSSSFPVIGRERSIKVIIMGEGLRGKRRNKMVKLNNGLFVPFSIVVFV